MEKKKTDHEIKKKAISIMKGTAVFAAGFIFTGVMMTARTDAAGSYPITAPAAIQSRGTLKYVIDGTTVQFCSSDLVNLRNELISLGVWEDEKFDDLDTKMDALKAACK
jgi:hypothetical protein